MIGKLKFPALVSAALLLSCIAAPAQMDMSRTNAMAAHVNQGVRLMRARSYQAAMSEFEAAKAIDPANSIVKANIAECYNNMGINLFNRHAYPDAIIQFENCLKVLPSHVKARHNMDLCRQRMDIEGIPDTPSEEDEKPDRQKKAGKESESDKKEDSSPKVTGSSSEMTVSAGGAKIFTSGSPLFPTYSDTQTAASGGTLPWMKSSTVGSSPEPLTAAPTNVPGSSTPTPNPALTPATVLPSAGGASSGNSAASSLSPSGAGSSSSVGTANTASAATNQSVATGTPAAAGSMKEIPVTGDAFDTSGPTQSLGAGAVSSLASTPATPRSSASTPANPSSTTAPGNQNYAAGFSNSGSPPQVPPAYTPTADGLTLDDKVSAIELKVYGHKNNTLPVMKRIEQLETDYVGQIRQGPMNERVEYLKKAIGQN